jgi:ABC-type sugar transport system ATPase subunit
MNLYEGKLAEEMGCQTYGIRPEHVILGDTGRWQGRVKHVEHLGADAIIHLDVAGLGALIARASGDTGLRQGDEVWASPQAGKEVRY